MDRKEIEMIVSLCRRIYRKVALFLDRDDYRNYAYWCTTERDWYESEDSSILVDWNPCDHEAYLKKLKWLNQDRLERRRAKRIERLIDFSILTLILIGVCYFMYARYIGSYNPLYLLDQFVCSVWPAICYPPLEISHD